jgi:3-keto-disaccharide hydrolase
MSSLLRALVVVAIGLGGCSSGHDEPAATTATPAVVWQTLFDGSSLDGWGRVGDVNWQIVDGAVQADMGTGFLLTNGIYDDFDLELEFWDTPDTNSGVFIRCANPAQIGAATCYEVNIFDHRPDPAFRTGAIVGIAKPLVMLDTANRWNTYQIAAHGKHMLVRLNGQVTVDTEDEKFAAGPIALQYAAGRVMFRNVRIRPN